MNAIGLTDHGALHGVLKFYKECHKQGINPIIGYEAYMAAGSRFERSGGRDSSHLTILAKNTTGWKNLIKLSSSAFIDGFYYRPRIDREVLAQLKEGLIVLSGCISSELSRACLLNELKLADDIAIWYAREFGNNFYMEIMDNGTLYQKRCSDAIISTANRLGLPIVCTADCHYVNADDHDLQDVMVCISTGRMRHQPKEPPRLEEQVYYLRSPQEMAELFSHVPDAVTRTQEIADQVNIEIETGKRHFPIFSVPKTQGGTLSPTLEMHLRKLCYAGLKQRLGKTNAKYTGRLERELKVIHELGFDEYFLVVADFCEWARERGITCTARGSGVGSLVCYCLWISHVDPIEYGLLFERFLDPSRREAPDIDVDFDKERRAEVMAYVKTKYGEDYVAQIGIFGTLAAKSAIKDVGRVEGLQSATIATMAGLVPELPGTTLADALDKVPELGELLDKDPWAKRVFNMAQRIEGMAKSTGTHAAGVVIGDKPLVEYVPLMKGKDGGIVAQWDMDDVEAIGLMKLDFLGLRNLTILSKTIRIIEDTTGKRIDLYKVKP